MSTTQPAQNPKPAEEEEPKTLEDLAKEVKKLKEIIAVYKMT